MQFDQFEVEILRRLVSTPTLSAVIAPLQSTKSFRIIYPNFSELSGADYALAVSRLCAQRVLNADQGTVQLSDAWFEIVSGVPPYSS